MPNKKKKKQSGNGFIQFALELRDKHPQKYKSLQDAVNAAGPLWNNMTADQKSVYTERAKLQKQNIHGDVDIKYSSDGIPLNEIEEQEREREKAIERMKAHIQDIVSKGVVNDEIKRYHFFIVHFNILFETNQGRIYPCEVAIAPFTLENGVANEVYHAIIRPGQLPLGYTRTARANSEGHQLYDEVTREPIQDNTSAVYRDIVEFLEKYKTNTGQLPILYTRNENLEPFRHIMNTFCDDFGSPSDIFTIYNLEHLFLVLQNAYAEQKWPNDTLCHDILNRDVYSHALDLACDFHEAADIIQYCSRSMCIRQAYLVCDTVCANAGIPLIPGLHVPADARVKNKTAKSTSVLSRNANGDSSPGISESGWSTVGAMRRPAARTILKFPPRPGQARN